MNKTDRRGPRRAGDDDRGGRRRAVSASDDDGGRQTAWSPARYPGRPAPGDDHLLWDNHPEDGPGSRDGSGNDERGSDSGAPAGGRGGGPDVPILLLWDRAPWHRGSEIQGVLHANPRLD